MSGFEPELGQMLFSNQAPGEFAMQELVAAGLFALGELVEGLDGDCPDNPCLNTGSQFENEVFALRAYCWCDGEGAHENGCPPNFEYKPGDFIATWYKHVHRGGAQSRLLDPGEWLTILQACVGSLGRKSE